MDGENQILLIISALIRVTALEYLLEGLQLAKKLDINSCAWLLGRGHSYIQVVQLFWVPVSRTCFEVFFRHLAIHTPSPRTVAARHDLVFKQAAFDCAVE